MFTTTLAAFLGGFFTAIFAEPFRRWIFRPRLALEFTNADHFLSRTREQGGHEAIYLRVKVTNRKSALAKSCRAYLVNIERRGSSGAWESTEYCESAQLAWSARGDGKYTALDLPKDVPHFIDILSTREADPSKFIPTIEVMLLRYVSLIQTHGTYRLTIAVSGDGVQPAWIKLSFRWSGVWNQLAVEAVD